MRYSINIIVLILVILFFGLTAKQIYNGKKPKKPVQPTITPVFLTSPTPATPSYDKPTVPISSNKRLLVSPDGSDSIQKVIDQAQPGDTIELSPGEYYQDVITKKDGLPGLPITITGPKSAIVKGAGKNRVFEVNHSYITLDGFTIDGHFQPSTNKKSYRDKLIYAIGKSPGRGVTNLRIVNMEIKNAAGECIRFRYLTSNNEVAYNSIVTCGVGDFEFNDGGKNGEGVYIGTAPEQLDDRKNPTTETDRSNSNWIHHNYFNTQGNECVDIKEGSSFNVIEYNNCTGQQDENSGGLDSRGNDNIFRYNNVYDNLGAGVRLGGDEDEDGVNNQVYNNNITNNKSGGIKFQRTPQGKVCGNEMSGNNKGNSVGSYGDDFEPEKSC